jgi:hypothetical protein
MRISRAEVTRRTEAATKFFKENPEAAGTAFNAALASSGERKMALTTVYKIREQARAEIGWTNG